MAEITFFIESDGVPVDPAAALDLGTVENPPAVTTPKELRLYFSGPPEVTALKELRLHLNAYLRIYPATPGRSAWHDLQSLGQWGGMDTGSPTGLQVNFNKANGYPSGSWRTCAPTQGWTTWNALPVPKEAIRLPGGNYHTQDGELPASASLYCLVRVGVPGGVTFAGPMYFSLVLDYEVVTSP